MRASRRWAELVTARLAEMERLAPGRGAVGREHWDRRARRYASQVAPAERDPLLRRVAKVAGRRTTILDVGAGPGRFALALAPRVKRVVAVDPSPAMLAIIRREARRRGLANVACVEGRWEDVEAPSCDVAICSYVLPLVADAATFLAKLDAAASRVFVTMNAVSTDVFLDTFWRHFHGAPRRASPTYLDAAAVLAELDIAPDVEVVEVPVRVRFANLAGAVRHYREELLLADTPEVRRELRRVLEPWLVGKDGALRPPLRTTPVAILGWQTGRR